MPGTPDLRASGECKSAMKAYRERLWDGVTVEGEDEPDVVNHPSHYTQHPSGVECIQITECMNFCIGNAVKYLWRADLKHDDALQDLRKAEFYIKREIERRCEDEASI